MATWVKFPKAKRLAAVRKRQNTRTVSENTFEKAVIAEASGSGTFARYTSGAPHTGKANIEVDITSASVI